MEHLYERIAARVTKWRDAGYPHERYQAIGEILEFQVDPDGGLRYLRATQLRALETYWYLRLAENTPRVIDLYRELYPTTTELLTALGITAQELKDRALDSSVEALLNAEQLRYQMIFTNTDAVSAAEIQKTLRQLGFTAGEGGAASPRPEQLAMFCEKWNVSGMWLFGSAARGEAGPESDVDIMVSFAADAHPTLFDLDHMEEELATLLGTRVDLVSRDSVEQSENWIRRDSMLRDARPLYPHVQT